MINALQTKKLAAVLPAAIVDNAAFSGIAIDCRGWKYCEFIIMFGAMDIAIAGLKVQESDDDSSYSDVTGTIFGTSVNDTGSASTLPSATADNLLFSIGIDCRGRKRYLKLVATGGDGTAGTYMAAIAELSRAEQSPKTAAEAGYSQRLVV